MKIENRGGEWFTIQLHQIEIDMMDTAFTAMRDKLLEKEDKNLLYIIQMGDEILTQLKKHSTLKV